MRYIAHRGRNRRALENTIPALLFAIEHEGIHGLEFDVQLAKCGTPMLFHDDDLTGLFGRPGEVKDYTAFELQSFEPLDLGR